MFVGAETLNPCQAVEGDHVKKRFFYLFLNLDNFNFKKSYSLRFTEENYKHLTGVTTKFRPQFIFLHIH